MKRFIALFAYRCSRPLAASALEVFACEPEWGALALELARRQGLR